MPILPQKPKKGFTLIEVVISILLILALVTILLVTTGTFNSTRNSNLQGVAAKIASKKVESLRKSGFANIPIGGPTSFSDSDLSKLPNATATQTVTYFTSTTKVKVVTINVDWTINGAPRNIKMETLVYEYGL